MAFQIVEENLYRKMNMRFEKEKSDVLKGVRKCEAMLAETRSPKSKDETLRGKLQGLLSMSVDKNYRSIKINNQKTT